MIIIGEKINSSIPAALEAINNHDEYKIVELIKLQAENGASYIDINTALTGKDEKDNMMWVAELVLKHSPCGIMLDSPNPQILFECANMLRGKNIFINSVKDGEAYKELHECIAQIGAKFVLMPSAMEEFGTIKEKLYKKNIPLDNMYIDVVVEALATNGNAAINALNAIETLKKQGVNTVCGLSNISFGLPKRAFLNRAFITMAFAKGLTAAIADPTAPSIKEALRSCTALSGDDEYCLGYIKYCRSLEA